MKKLVLLLIVLSIAHVSFAQNDQKAKNLLNEVSQKIKSYDNIQIEFRYSLKNNKENINQETRGDVTLKKEQYVLNLMGTTMLFDGTNLHTIVPEDEEVTISKPSSDEDDTITPSKMLTFYEKGYTYKWDIIQDVSGRKIQYIRLNPIASNTEIKDILLGIDSQTKHIYKLIQRQANGTEITITVNSFKTNQPLPNSLFKFDSVKYKNYYINKLD
ncbi:LolA family protein [Planktosalinus lacus]|nr:outer membrane lipoprotein carrier protein LolA [Planktosalinus lacus]